MKLIHSFTISFTLNIFVTKSNINIYYNNFVNYMIRTVYYESHMFPVTIELTKDNLIIVYIIS
jgi:hypothetical protein